jgi:hypothetical protein
MEKFRLAAPNKIAEILSGNRQDEFQILGLGPHGYSPRKNQPPPENLLQNTLKILREERDGCQAKKQSMQKM